MPAMLSMLHLLHLAVGRVHHSQHRGAAGADEADDDGLPRTYTPELYREKCDTIYQHIYDSYMDATHSIYAKAS